MRLDCVHFRRYNPLNQSTQNLKSLGISQDPRNLPHQPWSFGWLRAKNDALLIAAQQENSVLFHDVRGSFVYHALLTVRVSKYVSWEKILH